jgi:uncharacterized protein with HEPN domain
MAPSQAPALRLRHMCDEAQAIHEATLDLSFESFRDTWLVRRAVEHGLLIISEAAKSLPYELKQTQPAIPWRQIEALGNFLRHEYREVDPAVLWRIIHHDLPALRQVVREMLEKIETESSGS